MLFVLIRMLDQRGHYCCFTGPGFRKASEIPFYSINQILFNIYINFCFRKS